MRVAGSMSMPRPVRVPHGVRATAPPIYQEVDSYADFETSTDGTEITNTILDSCWRGVDSGNWFTVSAPTAQTPGATPEITIEADAAFPRRAYYDVNGTLVEPDPGSRGMRVVHSDNAAIQLDPTTAANVAVGFHFRWNGANQNFSPRDIFGLRSDPTGNYQFLQATDGTTPNLHAHWAPGGTGVGNAIDISKSRWYWVRMKHVDGGQTFTVEVYDAENNYTLVGTSTGAVSGTYTGGVTTIQIGCVEYASGSGQSFDFDNIILNFDGTLPPVPPY